MVLRCVKGKIMRRHKMTKRASKKDFRKNSNLTHKKNMPKRIPMRGGIRL